MAGKTIPRQVNTIGFVAVVLGGWWLLVNMVATLGLPALVHLIQRMPQPPGMGELFAPLLVLMLRYRVLLGLWGGVESALLLAGGLGLLRGREWGRQALMSGAALRVLSGLGNLAGSVWLIFYLATRIAASPGLAPHAMGLLVGQAFGLIVMAGWIAAFVYLIRWLRGPLVRRACAEQPAPEKQ